MKFLSFLLSVMIFLAGCKNEQNTDSKTVSKTESRNLLKYSKQLKMTESADSLFIFSGNEKLSFSKKELPLKTAMVVPTSVLSYLDELGRMDAVKGISQPDFVFNPKIIELYLQNKLEVIGSFDEIFVEKILISKPDIFVTSSGPTLAKYHQQIKNAGIRLLYIDEYLESEPLARAEYVKVFGKLFGKEKKADGLFDEIEKNYNQIISKIKDSHPNKPTVFANQIYGDVWYMPGGRSFQARLFRDAGGDYLWQDDDSDGSLKLNFESVYEKAANADLWLNAGDFPNLKSLVGSYKNYEWFAAVKNKKVYNWNKRSNEKGANDYFETGTVRPDMVLNDLAAIFYPGLFPDYELFFYKRLD